jgi:hypothetical protein
LDDFGWLAASQQQEATGTQNALLPKTRGVDFFDPDSGIGVGTSKNSTPTDFSSQHCKRTGQAGTASDNFRADSHSGYNQFFRHKSGKSSQRGRQFNYNGGMEQFLKPRGEQTLDTHYQRNGFHWRRGVREHSGFGDDRDLFDCQSHQQLQCNGVLYCGITGIDLRRGTGSWRITGPELSLYR